MSSINTVHEPPDERYLRAASQPRPVAPFAVSCRFDCARGEFVVRAGARAGATAVCVVAVLALGTFAYVRSFLAPARVILAEAPVPVPASVVARVAEPSDLDTPAVTATPTAAAANDRLPARVAGLNYLVLKSAATKREAAAACEALEAKGVAATVEQNLPGWSRKTSSAFTVVTLTGFDLKREQEQFDRHVKDLKKLKLNPKPYKWRGGDRGGGGATEVASTGNR